MPEEQRREGEEHRPRTEQDRREGAVSRPDDVDGDEHQEHQGHGGQHGPEQRQLPQAVAIAIAGVRGGRLLETGRTESEVCGEERECEPRRLVREVLPVDVRGVDRHSWADLGRALRQGLDEGEMRHGGRAGILLERGSRQAERGDREHPERGPVPGDAPQAVRRRRDGRLEHARLLERRCRLEMRRPRRGRTHVRRIMPHRSERRVEVGSIRGARRRPTTRRARSSGDGSFVPGGDQPLPHPPWATRCRTFQSPTANAWRQSVGHGSTRARGALTSHSARAGARPSEETRMIRRPSERPKRGDRKSFTFGASAIDVRSGTALSTNRTTSISPSPGRSCHCWSARSFFQIDERWTT